MGVCYSVFEVTQHSLEPQVLPPFSSFFISWSKLSSQHYSKQLLEVTSGPLVTSVRETGWQTGLQINPRLNPKSFLPQDRSTIRCDCK